MSDNVGAASLPSLLPKVYSSVAEIERHLHPQHDPAPRTLLPPPPPSFAAVDRSAPHLFLHFDVNETILVGDPAGGDTVEECLDKIIAKSAFVSTTRVGGEGARDADRADAGDRVEALRRSPSSGNLSADAGSTHRLSPTRWWNGAPLDPASGGDDGPPTPLYTGWTWPPATCPYYRTSYRDTAKRFTRTAHGRVYRPMYEHLRGKLGATRGNRGGAPGTTAGFENLLPAFWRALRHYFPSDAVPNGSGADWLPSASTEQLPRPPRVTLVLRTFGTDLPRVAKAISDFARGKHPSHPGYHNKDLILEEADLLRSGWRRSAGAESEQRGDFIYELHPAAADGHSDSTISGDEAVLDYLQSKTIVGIQDCYPFWRDHRHAPWAGKPVWARTDTAAGRRCRDHHHILLDDVSSKKKKLCVLTA